MKFDASLAYLHSDTPNNPRVAKCIPLFRDLFAETHYIGCSRGKPWNAAEALPGVSYHVDQRVVGRALKGLSDNVRFIRYIGDALRQATPDVVVVTNEEYVLPFTLGLLPRPQVLVCDLIDSIAIRIVGPLRYLNPLWSAVSAIAKLTVDGMVEVTDERLARHSIRPRVTTVVLNSPPWTEITPQAGLPTKFIYVCGNILDDISGVETLLKAAEQVEMPIVFAGRPIGPWMQTEFLHHPLVANLGETTPAESMRIAAASSAVFAHYKPNILNHVYAAPNKVFDAMMVGVPLLINSECKVSAFATRYGYGLPTGFGDVPALAAALRRATAPDDNMRRACAEAPTIFRREYAWQNMRSRWEEFFARLGVPVAETPTSAPAVEAAQAVCS